MLNSGLAILATNTIPEHTKRGVVAQILFCESSQSVTTKAIIHGFCANAFIFRRIFFVKLIRYDRLMRVS